MLLTIDGRNYTVAVEDVRRTAKIKDGKNTMTVLSGAYLRDVIGTYLEYTLKIGTSHLSPADYDALFEALSAPVDTHEVTLWYGQGSQTFTAYITSVSDAMNVRSARTGETVWSGLSVTLISDKPIRRPA